MKRGHDVLKSALVALFASTLIACGSAQGSQFEYSVPKFSADLSRSSFEYIKFGATGEVNIREHAQAMGQSRELGLVNQALKQIYEQAPAGEPVALVNVVMEVSKRRTTTTGPFRPRSEEIQDEVLTIRADIVRFVPSRSTSTPATESAPSAPPAPTPSSEPSATDADPTEPQTEPSSPSP